MVHFIDKDVIITEIEKRRKEWWFGSSIEAKYKKEECDDILSILDTLEAKEIDFEREMQAFAKICLEPLVISNSNIGISITMSQLYGCAKHFFELGMSVSNKAQKGEEL